MTPEQFKKMMERCATRGELWSLFNARWADVRGTMAELTELRDAFLAAELKFAEDRAEEGSPLPMRPADGIVTEVAA